MNQFTQSLRFKVTLLVIVVELLILAGFGVYYTQRFSQEIDNANIARLSIPGLLMSRGDLNFDAVSDKRTMEGLLRAPYSEGIVIGLDGRVYFSSDPARLDTRLDKINGQRFPVTESSTLSADAHDLVTPLQDNTGTYLTSLSPLRPDGKLTGYLYLKIGTETSEAEKRNISILFALGSLGTIVLTAAILTWLLNLTVIKRLNYLVDIFRRFALGDYAARAQPLGGYDEIVTLMNGFNGLAKRLEETMSHLRESQQRLDNIVANSPGAIYRCANDEHWTMEFISAGITQISGYAADDFFRNRVRSYASIIHPDDRQGIDEAVANSVARRERYEMDYRMVAADGTLRWVHEQGRGVFAPEGQLLYLDGVIFDITVQREAEDALRLSSERMQLATRVAQIGIWDWDVVKNELLWEESMYQLYGIQAQDFDGAYDALACTIHPEDRVYTEGEIQAALRGEREYAPEFRIIRPDGSIRYIKAESKTFKDRYGNPLRMIGTNIDITERKSAEEELKHYKDHLEDTVNKRTEELRLARDAADSANKAKSAFLANMSHELRTPLNAILGFSQLMNQDPDMSFNQRETLDIINNSGEHLLKLINDVLEIAKIEAGKQQLEIATFDLHELVLEVEEMMRLRAQQKGLQLELDQSSEFPRYIKGDEARLRQILVNLVSNAVKFTEKGSVTLRLGVMDTAQHHLIIEVKDTGPGISEKDQRHLFQPFEQLSDGVLHEGTGLGLTIVYQFVQLMGGEIVVVSTLGKGALFHVELPLDEADKVEVISFSRETRREVIGLAPGQPSYRILIAEDRQDNQILLSKLMTNLGLKVKQAHNGEECVALFKQWKPDLIWMDRRMPIMDGEEATRRIRKLPHGEQVKIVAVTASAFKEQQEQLLAAGMDGLVRKPFRFMEIYDSLSQQLGLEFIYREASSEKVSEPIPLTAAMMSRLSNELRNALREALDSLDGERIKNVIQLIGESDPTLAETLEGLADRFDYPVILQALDKTDGDI